MKTSSGLWWHTLVAIISASKARHSINAIRISYMEFFGSEDKTFMQYDIQHEHTQLLAIEKVVRTFHKFFETTYVIYY